MVVQKEVDDLAKPDVFKAIFTVNERGETLFEREAFGYQCLEIYLPDSPPKFRYPPKTIDGRPGIAVVTTSRAEAGWFDMQSRFPITPAQARQLMIKETDPSLVEIDGRLPEGREPKVADAYRFAYAWEMSPEWYDYKQVYSDTNVQVQFVVGE